MSPIKSDPHPAAPLPDECQTMTDVRKGVDSLDREIVRLLVIRQGYMHAAARIKKSRDAVYDEERIEDVVAKVLVKGLYDQLCVPRLHHVEQNRDLPGIAFVKDTSDDHPRVGLGVEQVPGAHDLGVLHVRGAAAGEEGKHEGQSAHRRPVLRHHPAVSNACSVRSPSGGSQLMYTR